MDIVNFKVDSARIEAGEFVNEIPGMGDLRLKVRGTGSIAYREAIARHSRAIAKGERNSDGTLPVAIADRITGLALSDAVLLDWENVMADGKPVPYDKATAERWLTDPNMSLFLDAVLWASAQVANAAAAHEKNILGNSAPASPGTSNGATEGQKAS